MTSKIKTITKDCPFYYIIMGVRLCATNKHLCDKRCRKEWQQPTKIKENNNDLLSQEMQRPSISILLRQAGLRKALAETL